MALRLFCGVVLSILGLTTAVGASSYYLSDPFDCDPGVPQVEMQYLYWYEPFGPHPKTLIVRKSRGTIRGFQPVSTGTYPLLGDLCRLVDPETGVTWAVDPDGLGPGQSVSREDDWADFFPEGVAPNVSASEQVPHGFVKVELAPSMLLRLVSLVHHLGTGLLALAVVGAVSGCLLVLPWMGRLRDGQRVRVIPRALGVGLAGLLSAMAMMGILLSGFGMGLLLAVFFGAAFGAAAGLRRLGAR